MDNSLTSLGASRAYQSAKKLQTLDAPRVQLREAAPQVSFTELLESKAREAVTTIRAGEVAAVGGLKGEIPMQQVVEATMAMESALKTTVALRDKVVEAYQEILRMSV